MSCDNAVELRLTVHFRLLTLIVFFIKKYFIEGQGITMFNEIILLAPNCV